jgi:hypothetical protein
MAKCRPTFEKVELKGVLWKDIAADVSILIAAKGSARSRSKLVPLVGTFQHLFQLIDNAQISLR